MDSTVKPLERYLETVKRHLPREGQDDILAELRANLEAQAEDHEAELGRPMTDAEVEAWLREMGSPLQMAARYKPQQYLIGPDLFPAYWYVLRLVLAWAVVIYALVSAATIAFSTTPDAAAVGVAIARVPWVLLITAAWVTLAFAILERVAKRNPKLLTALNTKVDEWGFPMQTSPAMRDNQTSRTKIVAEVIFRVLLVAWLLVLPQYPQLLFGPGTHMILSLPYTFAPVIMQFYWWVVAMNALQLLLAAVALARGNWRQTQAARHLAVKLMAILPVAWLLTAAGHVYFLLKHPALATAAQTSQLVSVNNIIYRSLWILFLIVLAQFLWDAGKAAIAAWHKHAAARQVRTL